MTEIINSGRRWPWREALAASAFAVVAGNPVVMARAIAPVAFVPHHTSGIQKGRARHRILLMLAAKSKPSASHRHSACHLLTAVGSVGDLGRVGPVRSIVAGSIHLGLVRGIHSRSVGRGARGRHRECLLLKQPSLAAPMAYVESSPYVNWPDDIR